MSGYDPFRIRNIQHRMDGFQAITFLLENRCSAPYWLYFETLVPFLGTALIRLLEFGALDIVRGYFRPQGFRSGRHFRRGRRGKPSRFGGRPGIPEVGNSIARRIPLADDLKGRSVSDGVRNLWMIDNIGQATLNYLLIADILDDTLVGWAQVLRSKACGVPLGTGIICEKFRNVVGGTVPCQGVGVMTQMYPVPGGNCNAAFNPGAGGAILTLSADVTTAFSGPPKVQVKITQDGKDIGTSSEIQIIGAETVQVLASAYAWPGKTAVGILCANPGFAEFTNIRWTVNPLPLPHS